MVTIQEAGLDGFWLHRLLEKNGIVSHVVEPASIAVPRRHRRAKTDAIDGETLIRTLAAWRRGEPRVCAMVRPPSPEEEDRRRLSRERDRLLQGAHPAHQPDQGPAVRPRDRRLRPAAQGPPTSASTRCAPATGGRCRHGLKAELVREIERLELVCAQIAEVEQARDR